MKLVLLRLSPFMARPASLSLVRRRAELRNRRSSKSMSYKALKPLGKFLQITMYAMQGRITWNPNLLKIN